MLKYPQGFHRERKRKYPHTGEHSPSFPLHFCIVRYIIISLLSKIRNLCGKVGQKINVLFCWDIGTVREELRKLADLKQPSSLRKKALFIHDIPYDFYKKEFKTK